MRMDLSKIFSSLVIREELFKEVKFYITGNVPDQVVQFLVKNGGKQELHITDSMTHLITGKNPSDNEIGEVRDIYQKPVVTLNWVILSAKCGKLLPLEAFDPDSSRLFHGVKASLSKVPNEDVSTLWALITYYGGTCVRHFDHTCTHLILGDLKGVKLQKAIERGIMMVTPDWVTDSIADSDRKDEFYYHPRLLNISPSASPFPETLYVKPANATRKRPKSPEPESSYSTDSQSAEPIFAEIKADTKKTFLDEIQNDFLPKASKASDSLFDSLVFSDEEDDGSDPEKKSLLDQLKCAQSWKDTSSSSSPVSTGESLPVSSSGLSQTTKTSIEDSNFCPVNSPPVLDSNLLSQILDDTPSSAKSQSDESITTSSNVAQPTQTPQMPQLETTPTSISTTIIKQTIYSSPDVTFTSARGPPREIQKPVTQVQDAGASARNSGLIPNNQPTVLAQSMSQSLTQSVPSTSAPPYTQTVTNISSLPQGMVQRQIPENAIPQTTPVQGEQPPQYNQNLIRQNAMNKAPDMMQQVATRQSPMPPQSPVNSSQPVTPQPHQQQIMAPQIQQQPNEMQTVVQLPPGMTSEKLNMMSPEQRQSFLEQLHQKQVLEQRARAGHPMAGKPMAQNVRYATQVRHGQPHGTTTQGWNGQQRPQSFQAQMKPGQNWTNSQGQIQQGAQPNYPGSQVQQQPMMKQAIPSSQAITTVNQQHGQPMQQVQHIQQVRQGQQMVTQHRLVGQQQFQQGTGARVVNQQWHGQTPQSQTPVINAAQPNPQQFQLQVQHLRQQFPHLTQQEAQQFLPAIPGHIREMQSRDSAGRAEYLAQLEPRESQVISVVADFYARKHQHQLLQRQQQLQNQQQQMKVAPPQQSPNWQQQQQIQQSQFTQQRPMATRTVAYAAPHGTPLVSSGQGSPRVAAPGQSNQQITPLASPHGHSPGQRQDQVLMTHPGIQQGNVHPSLVNQQNLVKPKTKTALANLLTHRLSGSGQQAGVIAQGSQGAMEVQSHMVQKPPENVAGHSTEHMLVYQRRPLTNMASNAPNAVIRPPTPGSVPQGPGLVRQANATHASGASYPRLHLFGHDINMLPRELCMVGCVFYIADYHRDLYPSSVESLKRVIQQHGGEIVALYDSVKVTHVLCKHQKSPVFLQAIRENKRCITIYWLNDILIRGKMAPPWQAIHLPTPFGDGDKPMRDMIVSLTGFENEERAAIKLMLSLAGAKNTGYFSKHNNLIVCKKFEGAKVNKAREWKKPVVNGSWLSEVLLGQNSPPLVYYATKYQHYLDDPLRIDPSLAAHLFNAWKLPIGVSKESVEKAKAIREKAFRKRKPESEAGEGPPEKKVKIEPMDVTPPVLAEVQTNNDTVHESPRIMFSSVKSTEEMEKKVLELGGTMTRKTSDATHLVMGNDQITPRTVKFMCAVSTAKYIISVNWLTDSISHGRFLPENNYMVQMKQFEQLLEFKLSETLQKENRNQLFEGKVFYLTPSIIPGKAWFKEIIECAGGKVDTKLKSIADIKERNKNGTPTYFCIACENDSHLVSEHIKEKLPVYNAEFVLTSILRQELVLDLPCMKFPAEPSQ